MPGAVHKIPDLWKDDTIIRVLAQQIMRKRKAIISCVYINYIRISS